MIDALQKILSKTTESETKTGVEKYVTYFYGGLNLIDKLLLYAKHFHFQNNKRT